MLVVGASPLDEDESQMNIQHQSNFSISLFGGSIKKPLSPLGFNGLLENVTARSYIDTTIAPSTIREEESTE